jgi:hypothetical protein
MKCTIFKSNRNGICISKSHLSRTIIRYYTHIYLFKKIEQGIIDKLQLPSKQRELHNRIVKTCLFFLPSIICTQIIVAQGTAISDYELSPTPNSNSVLDLHSTTRSILLPRIATASLLSTYVNGMMYYNSTTNAFSFYQNGNWVNFATNPLTTSGDLLYGGSSGTQSRLGIGSTGQILSVSGGLPAWSTATYPTSTTNNQLLYSSANNTVTGLAAGTNGQVLTTNSSGVPTWASIGSSYTANLAVTGTAPPCGTVSLNATYSSVLSLSSNPTAGTYLVTFNGTFSANAQWDYVYVELAHGSTLVAASYAYGAEQVGGYMPFTVSTSYIITVTGSETIAVYASDANNGPAGFKAGTLTAVRIQ